jgi:hypothetical protein
MKTLADFNSYYEFIYPRIEFMRAVFESNLIQVIQAVKDDKVVIKTSKSGKITGSITVNCQGKSWQYNRVVQDIYRIYAMAKKSPAGVPTLNTFKEIYDWLKNNADGFIALSQTMPGRVGLFQFAQVPEKGIDREYRQRFDFGKVNGVFVKGKVHEVLQAEEFERCGGKAQISSAEDMTVSKTGEISKYDRKNRATSGKKLDNLFEGRFVKCYTTNKAHTAELDGGGRTSEYEADAGKTIYSRSQRFASHGFEISDNKVVVLVALIDSRFFAGKQGPNAIRLMQNMANNTDTFITNAATLAKFIQEIDVPDVVQNPDLVIQQAFDKLAVEV